jgi:hypothetical protein
MKTIYLFLISVFFATAWTGCKEDTENTPSVAEGLKAYPGKNRAQLEFTTPSDAVACKVFYNSGQFQEYPASNGGSSQSILIEELAEGEQILRVVTLNEAGRISDPKGVKVNVYGANYQSGLKARKLIEQNTLSSYSVEMLFEAAAAGETGVWVVFTNTSGVSDSVKMSNTQTSVAVNNINLNEAYYYYSVYKPEPEAIDEFQSLPIDAKNAAMFNFEKEKWTVAGFSDEEPGGDGGSWGLASNIIDDNVATFWHSEVVASYAQMPHWITVDMQTEKKFNGFYFVQTQEMSETGLAKGFRFEISSDNSSWTNVLEGEFSTSRARQDFAFPAQVTARYFKITILSGYNDAFWSQFAEIDLYNELNVSGLNGRAPVNALVNAQRPFQGENPAEWGDGRMQQLVGWTHNSTARVSFATDRGTCMIMFAIPGGINHVNNGKVYQTVNLEAGDYTLVFNCDGMDGGTGVTAWGVVTTAATLPDITAVTAASGVLGYYELSSTPSGANPISFTLTGASSVTIGWVYNTFDTPHGWSTLYMDGIELFKDY